MAKVMCCESKCFPVSNLVPVKVVTIYFTCESMFRSKLELREVKKCIKNGSLGASVVGFILIAIAAERLVGHEIVGHWCIVGYRALTMKACKFGQ